MADRGQRRDRHPRLARGGLAGLDAGDLRGRRLRRRHRRAAHPSARHGARLALPAAAGRRHAAEPHERRDHRAPPPARHEPGDRLSLLAPARPGRAHRARAHGALRLAGRPFRHGPAGRGQPRGLLRAPRLGGLRRSVARRRSGLRSLAHVDRRHGVRGPHEGPQGRRPRAGGLDQAGGRLAGDPLPRAVARRDRRPARPRRAGDDRPPGGRGLVAQPPAGDHDRAGRPGAGGERRVRRAPAPPRRGLARSAGPTPPCRSAATRTPSLPCASRPTT